MKVTWPRPNEYAELCKSAEWQDRLAPARGILNGVVIGALIWVFCVWAWAKFARFF